LGDDRIKGVEPQKISVFLVMSNYILLFQKTLLDDIELHGVIFQK